MSDKIICKTCTHKDEKSKENVCWMDLTQDKKECLFYLKDGKNILEGVV